MRDTKKDFKNCRPLQLTTAIKGSAQYFDLIINQIDKEQRYSNEQS